MKERLFVGGDFSLVVIFRQFSSTLSSIFINTSEVLHIISSFFRACSNYLLLFFLFFLFFSVVPFTVYEGSIPLLHVSPENLISPLLYFKVLLSFSGGPSGTSKCLLRYTFLRGKLGLAKHVFIQVYARFSNDLK